MATDQSAMKIPFSCIAFVAGILVTAAATKLWLHDKEVLDRSFLAELRNIPIERGTGDDERYGYPIWENAETLHYLARTGDPDAVRVVVRLMARGYVPGGCCCTSAEFNQDPLTHGPTPAFWDELAKLSPAHQVNVIEAVDRCGGYSEVDALTYWEADRDTYLAAQPVVQTEYAARKAQAEAEAAATESQARRDQAAEATEP